MGLPQAAHTASENSGAVADLPVQGKVAVDQLDRDPPIKEEVPGQEYPRYPAIAQGPPDRETIEEKSAGFAAWRIHADIMVDRGVEWISSRTRKPRHYWRGFGFSRLGDSRQGAGGHEGRSGSGRYAVA